MKSALKNINRFIADRVEDKKLDDEECRMADEECVADDERRMAISMAQADTHTRKTYDNGLAAIMFAKIGAAPKRREARQPCLPR